MPLAWASTSADAIWDLSAAPPAQVFPSSHIEPEATQSLPETFGSPDVE
jgi:hypothetical protein